jgi:uncharacterized membrane protein YkoI
MRHLPLAMLCLCTVLGLPAAAASDLAGRGIESLPAVASALKDGMSLDEAVDRAQKRYKARVVRAETSESGGRIVYVLRLLSEEDGRVWTVRVDAQSGQMQ